jgi:hypothetical protein
LQLNATSAECPQLETAKLDPPTSEVPHELLTHELRQSALLLQPFGDLTPVLGYARSTHERSGALVPPDLLILGEFQKAASQIDGLPRIAAIDGAERVGTG